MKVLCAFSRYQYGRPDLGVGIEYAQLYRTLERMGHELVHFETRDRSKYRDFADLNVALLETVERERPDILFAVQVHYELWTETLDILRNRGDVATVNWTTDDSWKYPQFSRFLAAHYHAFTSTYASSLRRYHAEGHTNVLLTQWAASSESLKPPLPARECRYGVTFVGAAHGTRRKRVEELRARGVEVQCFGRGWEGGAIKAEDIPRVMRESAISLNFANSSGENQIKARTFEVPGAGGFLISEEAAGLEHWYTPGAEIVTYRTVGELAERIKYYLANPEERDRVAQAGYARTVAQHTYETRLREVLDFTLAQHARFKACSPGAAPRNLAHARSLHKVGTGLNAVRAASLSACKAIWGPHRGPRAARRIAFELSWRLAGARTFSAEGLPGRLFYTES
jgi:spore maturation protein CgeB